jgi:hypothetical protein
MADGDENKLIASELLESEIARAQQTMALSRLEAIHGQLRADIETAETK